MSLPPGTNCLTQTEDTFREELSKLVSVQAFVDQVDASSALERIFVNEVPRPSSGEVFTDEEWESLPPSIMIWTDRDAGFIATTVASDCFAYSGAVAFEFWRLQAELEQDDHELLCRNFMNQAGDVMAELLATQVIDIRTATFIGPDLPQEDSEEYNTPWIGAVLMVEWGRGE